MDAHSLPSLHEDIGTVDDKDGNTIYRMARSINGMVLYLFTNEPHPDDEKRTCKYTLSIMEIIEGTVEIPEGDQDDI
jgi:hypothetical protein